MFDVPQVNTNDKGEFYREVNTLLTALISDESDWLANLANASALLYQLMPDINWAGFYLYKQGELILGPFQGKPACVRIQLGKGVCGTAAETRQIQVVEDVNDFPGHIACDAASQSEIVLPIIKDDRLMGVLDIDSPIRCRFNDSDAEGLKNFVDILNKYCIWP